MVINETFVDFVTPVPAAWLNSVNITVNGLGLNVKAYGATGNGVTDDTQAIQNTITASYATGYSVYLPAGTYLVSSNLLATLSGNARFTMAGAGKNSTFLQFSGSTGLTVNMSGIANSFEFKDMTFVTSGAGTGTAVTVNQSANSEGGYGNGSSFTECCFRGADSVNGSFGSVDYWAQCIHIFNAAYVYYTNCDFFGIAANGGIGVYLLGTNDTNQSSVVHNFQSCSWTGVNTGIQYGAHVQGVTINQCNFVAGVNAINVPIGSIGPQLSITNSQFNQTAAGAANISIAGSLSDVTILGNLFFISAANGACINIIAPAAFFRASIVGNDFVNVSGTAGTTTGIVGNSNAAGAANVVTGNTFTGFGDAIYLGATSTGWNIQSNGYTANTTNVANGGSGNTVGGGSP